MATTLANDKPPDDHELSESPGVGAMLERFYVGCGEVGSEIGAEIARGLCNNATLQELNLGGNDLLAEGLRKLAVAFTPNVAGNKSNTSVRSLRLSSSVRGSEAVEVLANTLQLNTSLTSLDFSWDNALSPHNVIVLLSALKTNVGIKYLNLERCSGVGGDALFTALVDLKDTNPRVEKVRLVDTSLYTNRGYNMLVKDRFKKNGKDNHAPGPEDIFDPSMLDFSESIHPSAEGIIGLQSSSMKDEGTSTDIFVGEQSENNATNDLAPCMPESALAYALQEDSSGLDSEPYRLNLKVIEGCARTECQIKCTQGWKMSLQNPGENLMRAIFGENIEQSQMDYGIKVFTLLQDVCANPTFQTARHFVYILEWVMYHLDTSSKELQNFVMFLFANKTILVEAKLVFPPACKLLIPVSPTKQQTKCQISRTIIV
jgi:hypothetical protein